MSSRRTGRQILLVLFDYISGGPSAPSIVGKAEGSVLPSARYRSLHGDALVGMEGQSDATETVLHML